MRRSPTDAEHVLWQRLRSRRLGGYKFRRQVWLGPFIADFVCEECKLIVEMDGGQHASAGEYDNRRTAWLAARGYRVHRCWSNDVLSQTDAVLEMILRVLRER
jgi:very-short-patch-repair endonuclease